MTDITSSSANTRAPQKTGAVMCQPRERTAAFMALAVAFLVATVVCWAAWTRMPGTGLGGIGDTRIAGNTPGSGGGNGTGTSGDGPGAGTHGDGRGRDGTGVGNPLPAGAPTGAGAETTPEDMSATQLVAAPVEPPRIGFTVPDEDAPAVAPPVIATPSGVPDGNGSPGRSGKGNGGSGTGGGTEFMGVRTKATRVIYIIDFSGSMAGDRLTHTKLELRRSIEKLPDDGQYSIIFFDDGAHPMPPGKMVPATRKNKSDGIDWMRAQDGGGGTNPTQALEIALKDPQPDAIFLMTDGVFPPDPVFEVIDRLNHDRKVVINTIAFHEKEAEAALKRIATENRGDYTYIPAPPVKP